jgi:hypothetical protein
MRLNVIAIVVSTNASSFTYLVSLGSLIANIIKNFYCITVFVAGVNHHSTKMYKTLSIITFSLMTLCIMTPSIMTLGTMTLSITV